MSHSNLYAILRLKEFSEYLNNEELVDLSMCSSKIRECLLPEIFNSFNFIKFIQDKRYKSCFINTDCEEYKEIESMLNRNGIREYGCNFIHNFYKNLPKYYIESKARFQSDLNQLPFRPKKLKLSQLQGYDYLIYDLYSTFSNINILSINSSKIQLESLQHLLDNLVYLEDLQIIDTTLVKKSRGSNNYISLPLNLKKLTIGKNYSNFTNINENYIESSFLGHRFINNDNFDLKPMYLPNLSTLNIVVTYLSQPYFDFVDQQVLTFLKLNTHIRNLEIHLVQLKPEFFEIIKSFKNLNKLKLKVNRLDAVEIFKDVSAPSLSSLKYLDLEYYCDASIIGIIFEHFPNLIGLSYNNVRGNINEIYKFGSSIEKLKSLKKLKLYGSYHNHINKTFKLPKLKNLESLEFFSGGFNNLNILTSRPKSCPNLKLVKFSEYMRFGKFNYPVITTDYEKKCKVLRFHNSLAFYKLK